MNMTDIEFSTIQELLQKNGNILTLCIDQATNSGLSNGPVIYSLQIKHNLYMETINPLIRTTDDFENMIRSVLKNYQVKFNSTRSMFWLNS